jgi:hypothetical protein
MRKQEAAITPRVNRWVQSWIPESAAWDVKHTRGANRFDMREIKPHQRDYLLAAATDHGFTFKIEDAGFRHPPCDTVFFKRAGWCGFAIVFPEFTCYILAGVINIVEDPSITPDRAKDLSVRWIPNSKLPK